MTAPAAEPIRVDLGALEADIRSVFDRHGLTALDHTGVSVRVLTRGGVESGVLVSASAHSNPFATPKQEVAS